VAREPADIVARRAVLGARLAAFREAADLRQGELARLVFRDRTTVTHIEKGRGRADEQFWRTADAAVHANGELLAEFYALETARRTEQQRQQAAELATAQARLAACQTSNASVADVVWAADVAGAQAAAIALWAGEPSKTSVDEALRTASRAVIFKWLLARHGDEVSTLPPRDSSPEVTRHDLAALWGMKRSLATLDAEHGGGAALPLTLRYLDREVKPLLHGQFGEKIGRELFTVVAELIFLAGWMAYDAGQHGHARKQMLHALRLSHVAGDRLFGGRVLVAMSHQALHIGQRQDGIDFAAAATQGARAEGSPAAVALFAASEARAQAAMGDTPTCLRLMRAAEGALSKAHPVDGPEWLAFMDEAELAGKFGRCLRDLGMHRDAGQFLDTSLALHKAQRPRSRAITKIIQATNFARQGELESACQLGLDALPDVGRLRSQRTKEYLADLDQGLSRYQREPFVRSFREQAAHLMAASG